MHCEKNPFFPQVLTWDETKMLSLKWKCCAFFWGHDSNRHSIFLIFCFYPIGNCKYCAAYTMWESLRKQYNQNWRLPALFSTKNMYDGRKIYGEIKMACAPMIQCGYMMNHLVPFPSVLACSLMGTNVKLIIIKYHNKIRVRFQSGYNVYFPDKEKKIWIWWNILCCSWHWVGLHTICVFFRKM